MTPIAHVVHRTKGRLRLRIPEQRGNGAYFSSVEEMLAAHPLVESVSANPRTGSVLLVTDSDVGSLADSLDEYGLFSLMDRPSQTTTLAATVSDGMRRGNARLLRFSGGELDYASLVFLFMLVSGIYQVWRGNVALPAWYAAFYYAHHYFLRIQQEESGEQGPIDLAPNGGE
jgi:hypothetical protein